MDPEEFVKKVAELLDGLQVPLSMGMPLGKAKAPFIALRDGLGLHGWPDKEAHVKAIKAVIKES